jgi:hypothetical protein
MGNPETRQPRDSFGAGAADGFGGRPSSAAVDRYGNAAPFGDSRALGDSRIPGDTRAPGQAFADAQAFGDTDPARDAESYDLGSYEAPETHADPGTRRAERRRRSAEMDGLPDDAEGKGFLSALFDFGFKSFVTPKVIKVLYVLITIGTVVSALVFTIIVFKASAAFGVAMLVFGDPLFILIVLAIYRVILEFFVVTFRVAEDIRAIRERGDLR